MAGALRAGWTPHCLAGVCLCVALMAAAHDVPCNVTQDGGRTSYSVPKYNATSCQYSWANGTHFVVANHHTENKLLVLSQSGMKLVTKRCVEQVIYTRDCISEGISCHATCTTTCSGNAGVYQDEGGNRKHTCIFAFAVLLLLVGLLLAIRFGKCRRVNAGGDVEAQPG